MFYSKAFIWQLLHACLFQRRNSFFCSLSEFSIFLLINVILFCISETRTQILCFSHTNTGQFISSYMYFNAANIKHILHKLLRHCYGDI